MDRTEPGTGEFDALGWVAAQLAWERRLARLHERAEGAGGPPGGRPGGRPVGHRVGRPVVAAA